MAAAAAASRHVPVRWCSARASASRDRGATTPSLARRSVRARVRVCGGARHASRATPPPLLLPAWCGRPPARRMPSARDGQQRIGISASMPSALRRAVLSCVLAAAARAPAAWRCESWCNHYTCEQDACTDCRTEHGCGPGHENPPAAAAPGAAAGRNAPSTCAAWCDDKTCAAKECSGCENPDCVPDLPGCASWCNSNHCGIDDCSACDNPECATSTTATPTTPGCAPWCNELTCALTRSRRP